MKTNETTLKIKDKIISLESPIVMGIINCTPDSFFDESRKNKKDDVLFTAEKQLKEGASILDLGAFSTRPNTVSVSFNEELERVCNPLSWIKDEFPSCIVSIDTFRGNIAQECLNNGADIINDISGGTFDDVMLDVIKKYDCPYIAMHLQGDFNTMHKKYDYTKIEIEVLNYFQDKVKLYQKKGIHQVIIDPGFGFSKSTMDNFQLLNKLEILKQLNLPILVGISRKKMIWETLNATPKDVLNGTSVLHAIALYKGASILRVHDVKEAVEAIKLTSKFI
jgi:dihydropteroate synthase